MGFYRQGQVQALDREGIAARVAHFVADEVRAINAAFDPFLIDDPCPVTARRHDAIAACGEVVCCHCGKVFWQ